MSRIGFVLLTHSQPRQIGRLVSRLGSMFDSPPIVIHHDSGKCPLPEGLLPESVSLVRPHLDTGWAEFSVVAATVRALAQMYARPDAPDWCVVLSGGCYPTKPAAQILANLEGGGLDAHLMGREVGPDRPGTRLGHERYCVKRLTLPSLDRRLRPRRRTVRLPPLLGRPLLPFSRRFRCYWGSQWFSVSRRAAEYLVRFPETPQGAALAGHYRPLLFSEESYFQSALYNAPQFKIGPDNWVYLDWSEDRPHPKTLTLSDLGAIEASPAHFARKIDMDADGGLLDALDRIIDSGGSTAASAAAPTHANR